MDRVIKFRAWNKLIQKMITLDAILWSVDGYWAHRIDEPTLSGSGHLSDIIFLQFTGLLDKHGVEVYEGDMYRNLDNGLIGTFYYHNNVGGYTLYCREQNADGSPHNLLPFMQLDTTNFEIIGNIFEHSHLLTAQQ